MLLQAIAYISVVFSAVLIIGGQIPSALATAKSDDTYIHSDFILLLHDNAQPRKIDDATFPDLKKMLITKFSTVIPVGPQQTRLALVANKMVGEAATWNLITALTGDMSEFEKAMNSIEAEVLEDDDNKRNRKLEDGLALLTGNVFKEKTRQRPRVLFIYSSTELGRLKSAKEKIKELGNDYGVLVLLVLREFSPLMVETMEALKEELRDVAGDNGKSNPIGDFEELLPWIKGKIFNHWCGGPGVYQTECFYSADRSCRNISYTPKLKVSVGNCGDRPTTAPATECSDENDCEKTCDKLWPWLKQCNKELACGDSAENARKGPREWNQLRHCPTTMECEDCKEAGSGRGIGKFASMIWVIGVIGIGVIASLW